MNDNDDEKDGHKPYYPEHPGYVRGSETSKDAAHSVDNPKRAVKIAQCREILSNREPLGCTSDELERLTGWPHQTASAILRKLVLDGYAYDSAKKRKTQYGRKAVVRRVVAVQ